MNKHCLDKAARLLATAYKKLSAAAKDDIHSNFRDVTSMELPYWRDGNSPCAISWFMLHYLVLSDGIFSYNSAPSTTKEAQDVWRNWRGNPYD